MLNWEDLDPAAVERVAQMLVRDVFGATAIDGAGGDEAQDLRLNGVDGVVVFEVKSFAKRLAGSQKTQIRRSLLRAVSLHSPVKWVLVTRSNPRAPELRWLESLAKDVPGVELEWLGRDWLDLQVAGREDLISYVEGVHYKLLRRARDHGLEGAACATGPDFSSRLSDLIKRGDEISPFWRWDVSTHEGQQVMALAAKRPESADADPIAITPVFAFPATDPEAESIVEDLRSALRVGGDVLIPGRFVESFTVTAASAATQRLLGEPERPVENLRIQSVEDATGLPLLTTLRRSTINGPDISLPVTFTRRLSGTDGITLLGSDASGLLDVRFVLEGPADSASGRLTLTLRSVGGAAVHDAMPVLQILASPNAGPAVELRRGPMLLAAFDTPNGSAQGLRSLARLIAALQILQTHLGEVILVPEGGLDPGDIRELFDVADALSGRQVPMRYSGFDATVRAGSLGSFLSKIPDGGGALYASYDMALRIGDRSVLVPGLAMWAPGMTLANREDLWRSHALVPNIEHIARFEAIEGNLIYLTLAVDEPGEPWAAVAELG